MSNKSKQRTLTRKNPTDWSKHKPRNSFRVTPFFRDRPLKIAHIHVECAPAEPFTNIVLLLFSFFCRQLFVLFCFFCGYLGLRDRTFPANPPPSKKPIHSSNDRQGHIKYMCIISGSFSQKRHGHLDVCTVKCKNHGLASK